MVTKLLKLFNNSPSLNNGNHGRDGVWISDLNYDLLPRFLLSFSFD